MKNKTQKNIEKLARTCVDHMDMDSLCEFVQDHLEKYYSSISREEFNEEWDLLIGED